MKPQSRIFFGDYELDCQSGELRRDGSVVRLQPQPAKVLAFLASRAGQVVTRQELAQEVWGADIHVDFEHGLNFAIRHIRAVLHDDPEHPRFLETIPKRGYRFVAQIHEASSSKAVPDAVQGTKPTKQIGRRIFVLVTAAVVAIVGANLLRARQPRAATRSTIESLAVLPLHDLSPEANEDYFSEGMTDELITDVAKLKGLRVISHTSVERYKSTKLTLPQIAKELGVDAIVEGSVRRSGDRVRITAQLIDARTDQHLWADSYERDLREVLVMQEDVARQIAIQIGVSLSTGRQNQLAAYSSIDPTAHEAYLRGWFYWNRLNCDDFAKSLSNFEDAAARAPTFAPAYAAMADTHFELADWRCAGPGSFVKAEAEGKKALELDPALGQAHTLLGRLAFTYEWNWAKADEEFRKGLQLDPNNADIHSSYAIYLIAMGKQQEGLAELREALQLDPVSAKTNLRNIYALYLSHRYDEAIQAANAALDLFPNSYAVYYWMGQLYERKGAQQQAIVFYVKAYGGTPEEAARRQSAYEKGGLAAYWQADAEFRRKSGRSTDPVLQIMYYAHMNQIDKALDLLATAYQQHSDGLQFLNVEPVYDNMREDSRFKQVLTQLGL